MKLIGYAGYREDNEGIAEAFVYKAESAPRTLIRTSDNVRVLGRILFELELPSGVSMDSIDGYAVVVMDIMKAVSIALHNFPSEYREKLDKRVPGLTFNVQGPLTVDTWDEYQRILNRLMRAFAILRPQMLSDVRSTLELHVPNMRLT